MNAAAHRHITSLRWDARTQCVASAPSFSLAVAALVIRCCVMDRPPAMVKSLDAALNALWEIVNAEKPADMAEARRLALVATSRIPDPVAAAMFHERLVWALILLTIARGQGSEPDRSAAYDAIKEIEAVAGEGRFPPSARQEEPL